MVRKKVLAAVVSTILVIATLFGSMGAGVVGLDSGRLFAPKASAASVADLAYEIKNGKVTIIHCNESASGKLVIPSKIDGKPVTSIGLWAFRFCSSLTSVIIPDSVTSISNEAFYGCTGLTSVTIPDRVEFIGWGAFDSCDNITDIVVKPNNGYYSDSNGVLLDKKGGKLIFCPDGKTGEYKIPDGVTEIVYQSFSGCKSLTSVSIPDGVKEIERSTFSGCTSLTSVKIGNGVTSIGGSAFSGCTSLTSVKIPDSVTSIGDYAFGYCTSLTAITVGKNNPGYCDIDGVLFNKDKTILIQYPIGNARTAYTIPDCVTNIGDDAFSGCTNLTSVMIPDGVTYIGGSAFWGCTSLMNVTIGNGVKSIGGFAFKNCTSLTSVTIPDSVTEIGWSAFDGCSALADVYYGGSKSDWANITIDNYNDPLLNATIHYNSAPQPAKYILIYDANGGIGTPARQTGSATYRISSVIPRRTGYKFLGWSKDKNARVASYKAGDTIILGGNVTLYAVWEKNSEPVGPGNSGGLGLGFFGVILNAFSFIANILFVVPRILFDLLFGIFI